MKFKDIPSPWAECRRSLPYIAAVSLIMSGLPAALTAAPVGLPVAAALFVSAKAGLVASLFCGSVTAASFCAWRYASWQGRDMFQRWSGEKPQATFIPALAGCLKSSLGDREVAGDFNLSADVDDVTLQKPVTVSAPLKLKSPQKP
jgi:hypothetical protein